MKVTHICMPQAPDKTRRWTTYPFQHQSFAMMDKRDSNIIHAFLDYHGFHLESQKCWHRVLFNYNLFHQCSCGNFSTSIYVCPVFAVLGFFVCSVFVFTCSEWPESYLNYLLFLKACLLLVLFDFIILFLSLLFSNARIEDYKFSSDNCFVCITSESIVYKFSFYLIFFSCFLRLASITKIFPSRYASVALHRFWTAVLSICL